MRVAHFHPPRTLIVLAAVLAIVITLAVATRVNDTSAGSAGSTGRSAALSRLVPLPPWAAGSTGARAGTTPAWMTSPFAPLPGSPITAAWSVRGGS